MKKNIIITVLGLFTFGIAMPTEATLYAPANGMIYDDVLQVYWLENANLADTNTFGVSGIASSGLMSWDKANEWIAAMNNASYLGFNDWRLPTSLNQDGTGPCSGFTCNDSEMGHLYFVDNIKYPSSGNSSGNFDNVDWHEYWTSTSSSTDSTKAWSFSFWTGLQSENFKTLTTFAVLPVRSASSPVPEPSTALLFSSGFAGLALLSRRRKN